MSFYASKAIDVEVTCCRIRPNQILDLEVVGR